MNYNLLILIAIIGFILFSIPKILLILKKELYLKSSKNSRITIIKNDDYKINESNVSVQPTFPDNNVSNNNHRLMRTYVFVEKPPKEIRTI